MTRTPSPPGTPSTPSTTDPEATGAPPPSADPTPGPSRPRYGRYAGTYQLAPDRALVVHASAESLAVFDLAGHRYADLTPAGPGEGEGGDASGEGVFVTEAGATARFVRVAAGGPGGRLGLRWREPGGPEMAAPLSAAYAPEEVRIVHGDTTLAGELLLPAGPGPHPAAVLVHGSGPADRTSAWGLRHFLAWHGVAVLSCDKRGVGGSLSSTAWWQASFDVLAGDALAGVRHLQERGRARGDVDSGRIGLVGGSQAGWIAPLAAARAPADVAYVVVFSAPAVSVGRQELYRVEHQLRADGFSEDAIRDAVAYRTLFHEVARTEHGWDDLLAAWEQAKQRPWVSYVPKPPTRLEDVRWWQPNLAHDPLPVLERVRCPLLAFFGERDTLVPVAESAVKTGQALKRGGNTDHLIKLLPDTNHSMQLCQTGGRTERPTGQWSPLYAATLRAWLTARLGRRAPG